MEEDSIPALQIFHNFVVDFLLKCSRSNHSMIPKSNTTLNELSRVTGIPKYNFNNDIICGLDYDPILEYGIPEFEELLNLMDRACQNYNQANPTSLREVVYRLRANAMQEYKRNYVDKMLQIVQAVYPVMKNAKENSNEALLHMATMDPTLFWTCFWEDTTNLIRFFALGDDDDYNLRLHQFIEIPIRQLLSDINQRKECRTALQKIIDTMESRCPANRVLNYHSLSFNEALRITGLFLTPHHETLLNQVARHGMGGIPSRRSAAAQSDSNLVFFRF